MRVGSIVTHVEYPGKKGKVLAKGKTMVLVRWQGDKTVSKHVETALIEVIGS